MKDSLKAGVRARIRNALGLLADPWAARQYRRSEEEIQAYQLQRLRRLIDHAVARTPWYSARQDLYIHALTARTPTDALRNLPILTKDDVRTAGRNLWSRPVLPARVVATSGSTGNPMQFRASFLQQARTFGLYRQWRRSIQALASAREIVLTGFLPPSAPSSAPVFLDILGKRLFVNINMLGTRDTLLAQAVRDFRGTVIHGYPSAVAQFAEVWHKELSDLPPPPVVTTGEVLTAQLRELIENSFPRVYDEYGSQENAHLVAECRFHTRHINPFIGIVEILDGEGMPAPSGATGRVVVTGLNTFAMPLIRYDVGDRAQRPETQVPCDCKLPWPALGSIEGRSDDVVTAPDGRRVSMLGAGLTRSLQGATAVQLIQRQDRSILVRMVAPTDAVLRTNLEKRALEVLRQKLGPQVDVVFEYPRSIPRGANGKLRSVIVERR